MEARVFIYKWLGEKEVSWEKPKRNVRFEPRDKAGESKRENIGKKWHTGEDLASLKSICKRLEIIWQCVLHLYIIKVNYDQSSLHR